MLRFKSDSKRVRAIRLSAIYGPFCRFKDGADDPLDKAIEDGEKAVRTPEDQAAIDKGRLHEQQIEQEQANTRRANEATANAQSAVEAAQAQNVALQEKLEAAEAKAFEAGIDTVDLDEADYEGTDLKMVRAIKATQDMIKAKDTQIANLEKKASGYEQNLRVKAAKDSSDSNYEALLTDLDTEYGPECRNKAVAAFNAMASVGKVSKSAAIATRQLEKCYKDSKKELAKAPKKEQLNLDTGSGGGSTPNLAGVDIQEGSLEDVAEQFGKANAGSP